MKKWFAGILALTMCLGIVSCGKDNPYDEESEQEIAVAEPENTAPEYNTFQLTPEGLVNKLNNSGSFTKTWSTDFITSDMGDGRSSFASVDMIIGSKWSGTYENATNQIIDITIAYPCDSNDAINGMVACAGAEPVMEFLFGIDQDTAMSKWMEASNASSHQIEYQEYTITAGYNDIDKSVQTVILPKKAVKE